VNTTPLFSVLLPTHNRADVVGYAIQSVLGQTVQDFELLVVGDGCTDNTASVVNAFRDSRIRWFDFPKGPGFGYQNRNRALREARGKFIAFMAHDDLMLCDHLERTAKGFNSDEVELVYTRPLWVSNQGVVTPATFNLEDPSLLESYLARRFNAIPASAVVHRRVCHDRYGYWDDSLPRNGDWDMYARIITGGDNRNFRFISDPTVLHFRAIWKIDLDEVPQGVNTWRRFYELAKHLPKEVHVSITAGKTEQQVFWQLMQRDPLDYAERLQAAIVRVLDMRLLELEVILHTIPLPRTDIQSMAEEVLRLRERQSPLLRFNKQESS